MTEKRLVPGTRADQYYRFGGWFVDANSNGIMDDGETLLEGKPVYRRDCADGILRRKTRRNGWTSILEAGAHGSINDGEAQTLHTMYDRKWSEITAKSAAVHRGGEVLNRQMVCGRRSCDR